jgi:BirA family biotin operon repressor/biotin-[acetyl-CoA-carboxylase] ligase
MSLLLRSPPRLLPLVAAVAVCDAVGPRAMIKWPNDIVFVGPDRLAKLAGILVEGRPQEGWAVVGIGINVAVEIDTLPADLRESAATLGRSPAEIEPTLGRLLAALAQRLGEAPEETLHAWRERDALKGRRVTWAGGSGTAQGIDGIGRLVIAQAGAGQTALEAGEVHLQRTA